jgi:hypothetical protein
MYDEGNYQGTVKAEQYVQYSEPLEESHFFSMAPKRRGFAKNAGTGKRGQERPIA